MQGEGRLAVLEPGRMEVVRLRGRRRDRRELRHESPRLRLPVGAEGAARGVTHEDVGVDGHGVAGALGTKAEIEVVEMEAVEGAFVESDAPSGAVTGALKKIGRLAAVRSAPVMIRVEDLC